MRQEREGEERERERTLEGAARERSSKGPFAKAAGPTQPLPGSLPLTALGVQLCRRWPNVRAPSTPNEWPVDLKIAGM